MRQPGSELLLSTTLSQPVRHTSLDGQTGDNSENSALLSGVTFVVTDKDTDTTQGTFSVTIVDDVPSAVADGPLAPAEDTAITFSVTGNDVFGADGVDLVSGVAKTTDPTKGTVSYNGNGTFTTRRRLGRPVRTASPTRSPTGTATARRRRCRSRWRRNPCRAWCRRRT